jgi:hypothetical protein
MSKEQVVNIVPQSLNWNRDMVKGTRLGNASIQVTSHVPDQGSASYAANGSLSWNVPISAGNLVRSDPEVSFQYVVAFSDAATIKTDLATATTAVLNLVGMHSLPNNRCIESCTVKMNGQVNMSSNPATDANAILYNMGAEELARLGSCSAVDNLYTYDAATQTNVLRGQADSISWSRGLGATVIDSITFGANVLTVTMTHTEKLVARPFQWHEKEPSAFVGISNMSVNCNLTSSFANAALAANGLTIDSVTLQNAQLRLGQFSPHMNIQKQIPTKAYWNTPVIEHTVTAAANVNAAATGIFTSNSRSYSTVPKLYAVYAYTARTSAAPERMYPITNLSVNSGIKKNLLKSYSQADLYQLSLKNGFNGSASQFYGGYSGSLGTGCVVYFTPSDLDSELFHQSNVETNHVFNVEATVLNHSAANASVILRVVAFSDAVLSYDNGSFSDEMASINQSQLAGARDIYMDTAFQQNKVLGGSLWSWLKGAVKSPIFKAITKTLRNNVPILNKYVGDDTAIGKVASTAGYGKRCAAAKKAAATRKRNAAAKKKKGAGVINLGGRKLSKAQLMSLLN